MKIRVLFVSSLLLITSALIAACGSPATPTPLPTAPPPTDAPTAAAPGTPTTVSIIIPPAAGTATPAFPLPQPIAFALNKTQNAKSMKFDFKTDVTTLIDGKSTVVPGLTLSGVDSTLNRQVTISGTTSDTNQFITYDVVILGNDVYLKGLTGVTGVDPAVWYSLPEEIQAGVRRMPTALGLLASFKADEFANANFQAAGSETLDGAQCSVWSAQNQDFALTRVGATEGSDLKKQLGDIDGSEFKIWTCADGYIHQMTGHVTGHDAAIKTNTTTVNFNLNLNNLDQALEVKAPAGVQPFPAQSQGPTAAPAQDNTTPAPTDAGGNAAPTATDAAGSATAPAATAAAPTGVATVSPTP